MREFISKKKRRGGWGWSGINLGENLNFKFD